MTKYLLVITATLFSLAITAQQPEETEIHPLDVDKDGLISLEEAMQDVTLSAIFADLDVNQDGYLSKEELSIKVDTID